MRLDELNFLPLKVIHVGPKGKRTFDPQGKRKLIEVCRRSGASVASLALKAGINANQLRNWMALDEGHHGTTSITPTMSTMPIAPTAFVPVVEICAVQSLPMGRQSEPVSPTPGPPLARLAAQFPNGVTVELACTGRDSTLVAAMIKALGAA